MTNVQTSESSPIRINWLPASRLPGLTGQVGLTFAPGKHAYSKRCDRWERDLAADLHRMASHHQVHVLVCSLQDHELEQLNIPELVPQAEAHGMEVLRLPIPDGGVLPGPDPVAQLVEKITRRARDGKNIVIHCAGGLGRTGTIAGCLLVQHGSTAADSIHVLHQVRGRNCPETGGQEAFIFDYQRAYASPAVSPPLTPRQSQLVGAVLGAAIGDAMGHPTEFIKTFEGIRSKYGPDGVTEFKKYWNDGPRRFAPYTDDTQMAEAVLRGLLEGREDGEGRDATMERIAARFVEWERNPQGGHRGPGNACMSGCRNLARGTHWSRAGGRTQGGCGSVMRAYPLGLVFHRDIQRAEDWAVAQSWMTHRDPMATSACAAMAVGLVLVQRGEQPLHAATEMVAAACRHCPRTAGMITRAIDEALTGVKPEVTLQRLLGWRGDEAIAAAVYTFVRNPDDPRAAILEAANTPGDSDSLATLVGALVGARCGIGAFPVDWVERVERTQELRELALSVG